MATAHLKALLMQVKTRDHVYVSQPPSFLACHRVESQEAMALAALLPFPMPGGLAQAPVAVLLRIDLVTRRAKQGLLKRMLQLKRVEQHANGSSLVFPLQHDAEYHITLQLMHPAAEPADAPALCVTWARFAPALGTPIFYEVCCQLIICICQLTS